MKQPVGDVLMIAVGATLFVMTLARQQGTWSPLTFIGLACMAIGFGRLSRPRR